MKRIKILALVLAAVMVLASFAGCGKKYDTVIIGSSTELGGDFRWSGIGGSSAGAADQDVQGLTSGYETMQRGRGGDYEWNKTVVKSHTEEEIKHDDGSVTYLVTIEINPGLKMSNGEEVKAANYVAYVLAMSTPVSNAAFSYISAGNAYVGYSSYAKYDGTNAGEGITKEFSGIRLLGDYKFSLEVSSDYYPYYYAYTYSAVSPYDLKLVLGEGAEIKDDGNGCYISGNWYEKNGDDYVKVAHLQEARYDTTKYAFTGPYVISKWDESAKECTMTLNSNFAGDFTGRKATIPTIVYRLVVEETQLNALKNGEIDILEGLTGGESVNGALALVGNGFKENHYDRAGYGKIQFDCDFGPAMFAEVRQAVAYSFDRTDFANTFCGGYGSVISAPYSVNFDAAVAKEKELEALKDYASSLDSAKAVLTAGGWTYNSKGEDLGADWAPGEGADKVRYKKLAANEFGTDDANKTYAGVTSEGVDYKTVEIDGEYYMPLVINWMCSENNPVSDLLTTRLKNGPIAKDAGLLITKTEANFSLLLGNIYREPSYGYAGTPVYSMYNLATGWNTALYDYAFNWIDNSNEEMYDTYFGYSTNKLSDPYDAEFSWWNTENQGLSYDEAVAKSGGKLGMNYLSFGMVYSVESGDTAEYEKWFVAYLMRWNELLPDIPLYSNIYYDVYNSNKLNDLKTGPFWGAAEELIYQDIN